PTVDAEAPWSRLTGDPRALAEEVSLLAPFSRDFPAPVLASGPARLLRVRRLGADQTTARLTWEDGRGGAVDLLWFKAPNNLPALGSWAMLAYTIQVVCWHGSEKIEAHLSALAPVAVDHIPQLPSPPRHGHTTGAVARVG
ncbi:MAG TPA: hypothetical protein VNL71_24265, partial [Chloroflexota bacterium]|nr:hypothetical protein [Chloroflexota bacterium]